MGISLNPSTILSGQGIDVSTLVTESLSASDGQLTVWQGQLGTLQTQASDLTSMNNDLNSLATAVQALSDPVGVLSAQAAVSSDTGVLTATAGSTATAGTHEIVVNNLATPGVVYTNDFAGGASASILPGGATSGELDLDVGGTTTPIAITAGSNDTLTTLASSINSQNLGVTASVVTDANGSRLALTSQATGTAGALSIGTNTTNLSFNTPTGGANASLTIDGIPYSSASNTISTAIPGLTLNLAGASSSAVELTVGPDTSGITTAINNFVSAYNQVMSDINQQVTVNSSTNQLGPLGADSSVNFLQSSLLSDAAFSVSGNSGYVNLASLGISTNNDGTLTVNSSQLASALSSNPSAVVNFFQNTAATGFANNFNSDLSNLTSPTAGPLNTDLTQNNAEQQDLNTSISNFETQLQTEQTQLTNEFDAVNASLQAYPLLLQEVTATLGTLSTDNGSSSSSSSSPTLTSGL